jgi:hypothetical protein
MAVGHGDRMGVEGSEGEKRFDLRTCRETGDLDSTA